MLWGDLQVDKWGIKSGYSISTKLTQAGQQLVSIGRFLFSFNLPMNSVPSSIIVRSAAKLVSKT